MTGSEALEVLAGELEALEDVQREVGPVPLDAFFKEAAALVHTVGVPEIRAQLLAVGLEEETLEKLPVALTAAQDAQADWVTVKGRSYSNNLVELIATAHAERSDLLAAARFHLREDRVIAETLGAIAEGEGLDDLVQDLFALGRLIEQNLAAFERDTTFDAPTRARGARELAQRLQRTQTEEQFDTLQRQLRDQRDRTYTLLSRLVEETRRTGRYAFRKDPTVVGRFSSAYLVAKNRRLRRAAASAGQGEEADVVELADAVAAESLDPEPSPAAS
jgi:hypothetical protein